MNFGQLWILPCLAIGIGLTFLCVWKSDVINQNHLIVHEITRAPNRADEVGNRRQLNIIKNQTQIQTARSREQIPGLEKLNITYRKIAFMFLVVNSIPTSDIWASYFSAAPRSEWSVYVHLNPRQSADFLPSFFRDFALHESDRSASIYCKDLVSPTIALIRVALRDHSNKKFIIMSPTHIPVKPFPMLRNLLFRDDNTWLCLSPISLWTSIDPGKERPKHHQWIAFSRDEAERQVKLPHPFFKGKSGCRDELWIYPPRITLSEAYVRSHGGRPWPGFNDGLLHTRAPADASRLVNTTLIASPRLAHGVRGRCSAFVFWSCSWCGLPDQGRDSDDPFTAVGPYWGDTRVGKRHELGPISYCLLEFLMNGTDFLFARKVFEGVQVSRKCLGGGPGLGAVPVEAALRLLGVLPRQ